MNGKENITNASTCKKYKNINDVVNKNKNQ